jgi:hypothetical protein
MGQFGTLGLLQQVDGGLTATCPVISRYADGNVLAKDGLAIMDTDEGPVAMNLRSAWQAPDPKFLVEALKRAESIEEEIIPVPTPRQGYRMQATTSGIVAKLRAEDAQALAVERSIARYTDDDGNITDVSGVIVVTSAALNALGLSKLPVQFEKKRTKPYDCGNWTESAAFVRENGAVPYNIEFTNGDELHSFGFPKGTQRSGALEAAAAELAANSVLSQVNTGTVVRAAAATGNAAQAQAQTRARQGNRPAPRVQY